LSLFEINKEVCYYYNCSFSFAELNNDFLSILKASRQVSFDLLNATHMHQQSVSHKCAIAFPPMWLIGQTLLRIKYPLLNPKLLNPDRHRDRL